MRSEHPWRDVWWLIRVFISEVLLRWAINIAPHPEQVNLAKVLLPYYRDVVAKIDNHPNA